MLNDCQLLLNDSLVSSTCLQCCVVTDLFLFHTVLDLLQILCCSTGLLGSYFPFSSKANFFIISIYYQPVIIHNKGLSYPVVSLLLT